MQICLWIFRNDLRRKCNSILVFDLACVAFTTIESLMSHCARVDLIDHRDSEKTTQFKCFGATEAAAAQRNSKTVCRSKFAMTCFHCRIMPHVTIGWQIARVKTWCVSTCHVFIVGDIVIAQVINNRHSFGSFHCRLSLTHISLFARFDFSETLFIFTWLYSDEIKTSPIKHDFQMNWSFDG